MSRSVFKAAPREFGRRNRSYSHRMVAADLETEALEVFLAEQVTDFIAVSPSASPRLLRWAVEEGLHITIVNWDGTVPAQLFQDAVRNSARPAHDQPDIRRRQRIRTARSPSTTQVPLAWRQNICWNSATPTSSISEGRTSAPACFVCSASDVRSSKPVVGPNLCCPLRCPPWKARATSILRLPRDARARSLWSLTTTCLPWPHSGLHTEQAGVCPGTCQLSASTTSQFSAYTNPSLTTTRSESRSSAVSLSTRCWASPPSPRSYLRQLAESRLVVRESTSSPLNPSPTTTRRTSHPRARVGRTSVTADYHHSSN